MTGQPDPQHDVTSQRLPSAYADFLIDRLTEEIDAALLRPINKAGLVMLVDLRAALRSSRRADQTSVDVLTMAYASHPHFDTGWAHPH